MLTYKILIEAYWCFTSMFYKEKGKIPVKKKDKGVMCRICFNKFAKNSNFKIPLNNGWW